MMNVGSLRYSSACSSASTICHDRSGSKFEVELENMDVLPTGLDVVMALRHEMVSPQTSAQLNTGVCDHCACKGRNMLDLQTSLCLSFSLCDLFCRSVGLSVYLCLSISHVLFFHITQMYRLKIFIKYLLTKMSIKYGPTDHLLDGTVTTISLKS